MKKLTIPTPAAETIDWSKPQWVVNNHSDRVVLTTGKHRGRYFSGTCMPCEVYPYGEYATGWNKPSFQLLTIDIPFTISNKD